MGVIWVVQVVLYLWTLDYDLRLDTIRLWLNHALTIDSIWIKHGINYSL